MRLCFTCLVILLGSPLPVFPESQLDSNTFTVRGLPWGASREAVTQIEEGRLLGSSQYRMIFETKLCFQRPCRLRWRAEYTFLNDALIRVRMNTKDLGYACVDVFETVRSELAQTYGPPLDESEGWRSGVEEPFDWFGLRSRVDQCGAAAYGLYWRYARWAFGGTTVRVRIVGEEGKNGILVEYSDSQNLDQFEKLDDSDEEFKGREDQDRDPGGKKKADT